MNSSKLVLTSEASQKVLDVIAKEIKVYKTLKSNLVRSMFVFTYKELTIELYSEYFI